MPYFARDPAVVSGRSTVLLDAPALSQCRYSLSMKVATVFFVDLCDARFNKPDRLQCLALCSVQPDWGSRLRKCQLKPLMEVTKAANCRLC